MNRGYSREEYLDKVAMIRQAIPGAVLSTDIIVGFPGETEAQFEDTYSLVEQVRYENLFAFKYSPRPFTKAAKFTDHVEDSVAQVRLLKLFEMQRAISFDLAKNYDGLTLDVLVDSKTKIEGQLQGRSTQNKLVFVTAPKAVPRSDSGNASGSDSGGLPESLIGQIVPVKIHTAFPNVLRGEIV